MSDELITRIDAYEGGSEWDREAGFQVTTTEQVITLAIDDSQSCCESWGYFITEDDPSRFVGARLRGIEITDTNRSNRRFVTGYGDEVGGDDRVTEHIDEGGVMFVDIQTDRGVLQFVAYNAHNGYYGHEARVRSRQLEHSAVL